MRVILNFWFHHHFYFSSLWCISLVSFQKQLTPLCVCFLLNHHCFTKHDLFISRNIPLEIRVRGIAQWLSFLLQKSIIYLETMKHICYSLNLHILRGTDLQNEKLQLSFFKLYRTNSHVSSNIREFYFGNKLPLRNNDYSSKNYFFGFYGDAI